MEQLINPKNTIIFSLFVLLMIPAAGTVLAQGPGGWHGKGMMGNASGPGAAARMEKMKTMLNLSEEQKVLMNNMHQANRALRNITCPDGAGKCTPGREQIRTRLLFKAELAAENPDFQAVADKVKAEYQGKHKAEFDAAVDAKKAFMESLTPEQRDSIFMMKGHGGFHRRYHGN